MKNFVEIRTIESDIVYYVRRYGSYHISAPHAYLALTNFIIKNKLDTPETNKNVKMYGIPHNNPCITPNEECTYDSCITLTKHVPLDGNVQIQTIEGGKYAVFLHKGSYDNLGPLYYAIYSNWLPKSGYDMRTPDSFNLYLNSPAKTAQEELLTEIFIPIE